MVENSAGGGNKDERAQQASRTCHAPCLLCQVGDSTIPWNDQFRFFMTTKLSNPHYPPEVSVKVSLLNFAITFTGLEDQLLGVVVVEEMPEMQEKKNTLGMPDPFHCPLVGCPTL